MKSININMKVEQWWNDIDTTRGKPFPIAISPFKSHKDWSIIKTGHQRQEAED
jgi:hypothetical protein